MEMTSKSYLSLLLNGALTVGTLDGANVEIVERVGYDNAKIFGLRVEDINRIKKENSYNARNLYNQNPRIRMVLDSLKDRTWSDNDQDFNLIYSDILLHGDEFYVLADFDAYCWVCREASNWYQDKPAWARAMLINIAKAGYFSSDRTIRQYAKEIWGLEPIPFTEADYKEYHDVEEDLRRVKK